jgi:hypothetical protein
MISSDTHSRWPLQPPSWIWFLLIRGQTPVAYWGWLEEGSFRWSASPLFHWGLLYSCVLGFGFRQLDNKCLGRFIRFFCGLLGVITGRFLSIISSATHPRWPLGCHLGFGFRRFSQCVDWSIGLTGLGRLVWFFGGSLGVTVGRFLSIIAHPTWLLWQPSWIWFPSIIWRTSALTSPIFGWLIGGSSSFTKFHFSLNLIFCTPTDNFPLGAYATPSVALVHL